MAPPASASGLEAEEWVSVLQEARAFSPLAPPSWVMESPPTRQAAEVAEVPAQLVCSAPIQGVAPALEGVPLALC
jgi:hypothetical protein